MDFVVLNKSILEPEGFPMFIIPEGSFSRVDFVFEISLVNGASHIQYTHSMPLSSIHFLVMNVTGSVSKEFPTFITFIWLFSRVNSQVLIEFQPFHEGFPTYCAFRKLFSNVDSLV